MAHEETGTVPYQILFLGPLKRRVLDHFDVEDVNRAVGNYVKWDIPGVKLGRVDFEDEEWLDEWGVRWKGGSLNRGYIIDHPLKRPDLSGFNAPVADVPERAAGMAELCEANADLYLLAWCGDLFERAHFLRGMEQIMVDFYEDPAFVHDLLDTCLAYCLGAVRMLSRYPVDAMILSDDYGQQSGPLISPKTFREFFKPRLKQIFDAIHAAGKTVALHSCGDVSIFIPDFIEIGLEVLHPVQPEAMDVHAVKREFGRDLCLFGGISEQQLMRLGTPDEIRDTVRRERDLLSKGGGCILAPSLDLTHDVPFENVIAFLEAANEQ